MIICFDLNLNQVVIIFVEKMSEVFEGYERQYCELSTNLSRKCVAAVSVIDEGIIILF